MFNKKLEVLSMKGKKVLQLGLGMQGKAALYDIVKSDSVSEVIVADSSPDLNKYVTTIGSEKVKAVNLDATDTSAIKDLMKNVDIVIELLPNTFAFPIGQMAAEIGVNLVSSSYFSNINEQDLRKRQQREKDLEKLHQEAQKKDISILCEFGMDPGIDLILSKQVVNELDEVQVFYSYGAGFPDKEAGNNPIHYKFTWSVAGVLGSYLRSARIISEGKSIDIKADEMFAPENTHVLKLDEIGFPLECFANGDSVHYATLLGIKENVFSMGRYICRWAGHGAFWYVMAKSGLIDNKPVELEGIKISPNQFVANILASQKQFHYRENERDVALIRIDGRGLKNGKPTRIIYQIIDKRNLETGFTSMQRTVGFTASIGAQMILDGILKKKGLLSPMDAPFDYFLKELQKRDMDIRRMEFDWKGEMEP